MSIEVNATEQIIEVNATGSTIDINVTSQTVDVNATTSVIDVEVSNGPGPAGPGVPTGGTTGQVLKKQSATDYDTYWAADTVGVPYIGATGNVDLGEYELKAGQLTLDTTPTGTASVGTTRWNDTIGSSETTLKGGSVILKNGVDLVARVVNKVTPNTTLTKAAYQAVRISGAQGQRLAVAFAQANNDNNSADTIGLVTETIATNQEGFIMTVGNLEDINTTGSLQGETWADGDVLYLSPTVAGAITNIKPVAPQHLVVIGYVEYAHAVHGKIYVKVMNGWELGELHDVNTTGATAGQVLKYNGTIWTPSSDLDTGITSLNGLTDLTQTFATGTTGTDFNISSATSTHTFNLPTASAANRGLLSTTDWSTFNNKQDALGYTPVPTTRILTINGTAFDLSADRSWTVSGTNIYTDDGTLTGNRTVTANGNSLTFLGGNEVTANEQRGLIIATSTNNKSTIELLLNNTFTTTGKAWRFRSLSGGDFDIATGTSRYFYIASDGKVVINSGTAIASAQFSVSGKIASNAGIQLQGALGSPTGAGVEIEYNAGTSYFTSYNRTGSAWLPIIIRGSQIDLTTNGSNTSRLFSTGNLTIGGTTDGGQRLQVQGDAFIKGSGNTSATTALTVQNSDGTNIFRAGNSGIINFNTLLSVSGQLVIYHRQDITNGISFGQNGSTTLTSGLRNTISVNDTIAPTSGTLSYTNTLINATINQTGGANGITRGLYINPTLTSAADWRSIEWSNNTGWGLFGSGNSPNYLNGSLGLGNTSLSTVAFRNFLSYDATRVVGMLNDATITVNASNINSYISQTRVAASIAVTNFNHFQATQISIGAGATISNQIGFIASSALTSATNNFGFYGDIPSGTGRWNLYMNGTANNYMAGDTGVGTATLGTATKLTVGGSVTASSAIARGQLINTTLVAAANSDILIGLDISPTFTNGAFTGVRNLGFRIGGATGFSYDITTRRVGIGAYPATSLAVLDIQRNANEFTYLRVQNTNSGSSAEVGLRLQSDSGLLDITNFPTAGGNSAVTYFQNTSANGMRFWNNTSSATANIDFATGTGSGTVRARIFSTGNFIIGGTTDAGYKLDVQGTGRFTGTIRGQAAFGLELSASASYLSLNGQQYFIGDGPSLVGGLTAGLAFRGSAFVYGTGTVGYHYLTNNYALFSTQSSAVNLSTGIPASAVLEARSTTKGFLPPRMTTTQKNAIATPAAGLQVYDTTLNQMSYYNGTTWINF